MAVLKIKKKVKKGKAAEPFYTLSHLNIPR
jgi:hypothetical protein